MPGYTCVHLWGASESFSRCMQRVDPSWDPYHEKRITLGGLVDHYSTIKRGRRVMFVACGTSFHACLACRQTMEELAELPVCAQVHSHVCGLPACMRDEPAWASVAPIFHAT